MPKEAFLANMGKAIEARFTDAANAVKKIRARGGRVVFVRFPVSGALKAHEDKMTPRQGPVGPPAADVRRTGDIL